MSNTDKKRTGIPKVPDLQYGSNADDVEFGGSQFVFAPQQGVQCDQSVQQATSASSWGSGW
jgi:hypothetical protein